MYKRKTIRLIALLMTFCMLLSLLPGSGLRTEAAEAEELEKQEELETASAVETQLATVAQTLSEDCKILNYVHAEVFGSANHVARLTSEETLSSYVFLNADGTRTAYYLDEAVKFVDADGKVQEKDLMLVPTVGGYTTEKNDIGLSIPTNPASGITLLWNNTAVRIIPQGGTVGETVVEDNTVRYVDYYGSGMDLVYTPTLSGLKEDIVLESYTGENTFTFMLNTGGLNLYSASGRYYLAASKTATDRIDLGDVVTFDTRGRFSMGTMTAQTVTPGQIYRLTLTVDEDFLADPNTAYPVSIDPTLTVSDNTHGAGAIEDVSIYQGKPTTNGNWTYLHSGYYDSNYTVSRTLFRLTGLINSSEYQSLTASKVNSAYFYIWEASGTTATDVYLRANTGSAAWTENGATWNNAGVVLGTTYDTKNIGINAQAKFTITNLVKSWLATPSNAQKGFVLQSSNETSLDKAFYSSEHGTTTKRPYVELNYASTENTIGLLNTKLSITKGYSASVGITTVPSDLSVTWTSSNPSVATVDSTGRVTAVNAGKAIIIASAFGAVSQSCTVYVTLSQNSVYRIRNKEAQVYLDCNGANIAEANLTNIKVKSIISSGNDQLAQLWRLTYVDDGYYFIRPMHKLDYGLYIDNGDVKLTYIGTNNTLASAPEKARWTIEYIDGGYVFKCAGSNARTLQPFAGVAANNSIVSAILYDSTAEYQKWLVNPITPVPSGILLYDTRTGLVVEEPQRHIAKGQTKAVSELFLLPAVYASNFIDQSVDLVSCNSSYAGIDSSADTIVGLTSDGVAQIEVYSAVNSNIKTSISVEISAYAYAYYHYYDALTFSSEKRALINDAVLFADSIFYSEFGVALWSCGAIQEDNITGLDECPIGNAAACGVEYGCGSCNGNHHKDLRRIAEALGTGFQEAFRFRVLWTDYPDDTFCDHWGGNGEGDYHAVADPCANVYPQWPNVIHIVNLSLKNASQTKAHMALLLAHETVHCFGFADVYDKTGDDASNKHDFDGNWVCLMDYFESDQDAAVEFYDELLRGTRNAFCQDCNDLVIEVITAQAWHDHNS